VLNVHFVYLAWDLFLENTTNQKNCEWKKNTKPLGISKISCSLKRQPRMMLRGRIHRKWGLFYRHTHILTGRYLLHSFGWRITCLRVIPEKAKYSDWCLSFILVITTYLAFCKLFAIIIWFTKFPTRNTFLFMTIQYCFSDFVSWFFLCGCVSF
jgi:hypothetical protein